MPVVLNCACHVTFPWLDRLPLLLLLLPPPPPPPPPPPLLLLLTKFSGYGEAPCLLRHLVTTHIYICIYIYIYIYTHVIHIMYVQMSYYLYNMSQTNPYRSGKWQSKMVTPAMSMAPAQRHHALSSYALTCALLISSKPILSIFF